MSETKYLDYEGLVAFKNNLDSQRLADKAETVGALNNLSNDIHNGILTIQRNGVTIATFTANQINGSTANVSVPTSLGDLNNSVEYIQNIILYGLPDVSNLTEEQKKTLHELFAENSGLISEKELQTKLVNYGTVINYDSARQYIQLKNGNTVLSEFSAADFIKDGMVENVVVSNGKLVITFNTDSGLAAINIPISDIFNANNYYTKSELSRVATTGSYSDLSGTPGTLSSSDINTGTDTNAKLITAKAIKDAINTAIYGGGTTSGTVVTTNSIGSAALSAGFAKSILIGSGTPVNANSSGVLLIPAYPSLVTVPTKTSLLTNDSGFLTSHLDISGKADKSSLATVATTGNYNDLSNKPTIPSAVTESTVSGWGFTKNAGTVTLVKVGNSVYNPSLGVVSLPAYPTSLPASDVSSWAKASSKPSYSYSEISGTPTIPTKVSQLTNDSGFTTNSGTVTQVKVGTTAYNPSSGVVSLPAYPTSIAWGSVTGKPSFATVATSGSYNDLSNKPSIVSNYNGLTYTGSSTTSSGGAVTIDGSTNVFKITASASISGISLNGIPGNYHSCHIIIMSSASDSISVSISDGATMTIGGNTYTLVCPGDSDISLSISSGKYIEFDILRIDNELFVRGV